MTLKDELIDAITNEKNAFDMTQFGVEPTPAGNISTACGTARCMGGWIIALRPKKAFALFKLQRHGVDRVKLDADEKRECIDYGYEAEVAAKIWEDEMGEKCRLDFMADRREGGLYGTTREEAIAHIKGRSRKWPLLAKARAWDTSDLAATQW